MNLRLPIASLAGILAVGTPAIAIAPEVNLSGQASINIVGWVPVVCRATVDATAIAPSSGTVQLGSLNEFCNNPNGFRVVADYSPALTGAQLTLDGNVVTFGEGGSTVIKTSNEPAIASHPVSLNLPEGVVDGAISFRVEPL